MRHERYESRRPSHSQRTRHIRAKCVLADASYATYFNGYLLFVRETTLMAQPVDPKTMEFKGELFPVAEQVAPGPNPSDELYSISENGILVIQTGAGLLRGRQYIWKDRA